MDARVNPAPRATLEDLVAPCHRSRAAAPRQGMGWGFARAPMEQSVRDDAPGPGYPLLLYVNPERLQQRQEAADRHGVTVAAWTRHARRQVT